MPYSPRGGEVGPMGVIVQAQLGGWHPNDLTTMVDLGHLVPFLIAYVDDPAVSDPVRERIRLMIEAIGSGTVRADQVFLYMHDWEQQALSIHQNAVTGRDFNATEQAVSSVVVGALIQALGRATGGAFTRAAYPAAATANARGGGFVATVLSVFLQELTSDFDDELARLFSDLDIETIRAQRDALQAANPGATAFARFAAAFLPSPLKVLKFLRDLARRTRTTRPGARPALPRGQRRRPSRRHGIKG